MRGINTLEKANIGVKLEITMMANGKMVFKTEKGQKPGLMILSMMDITRKVISTVKERIHLLKRMFMKVSGKKEN